MPSGPPVSGYCACPLTSPHSRPLTTGAYEAAGQAGTAQVEAYGSYLSTEYLGADVRVQGSTSYSRACAVPAYVQRDWA